MKLEIKTYMTNAEKTRRSIISALIDGEKDVVYLRRKVFADTFRAPHNIKKMLDSLVEEGILVKRLDETKEGNEAVMLSLNPKFRKVLFESRTEDSDSHPCCEEKEQKQPQENKEEKKDKEESEEVLQEVK